MEALSLKYLAEAVGGTEPALRLFISILLGYPIALIHRHFLYGKSPFQQHLYFTLTGILVGIFCYGWGIIHPIAAILAVYPLLYILGGSFVGVVLTLVFTMTYLLVGYYTTSTFDYDIKWTMSQCVLTLRLTGVAIDLFDGQQPTKSLSEENKKSALQNVPSLLEITGHSFFPAAFLVGPQFHMKRYQNYVAGTLIPLTGSSKPNCVVPAMKRLATGMLYLAMHQIGVSYVPENYIETPEFNELGIIKKHLILGFWMKVVLYKYITCWLVAEGVCILSGISYSGTNEKGEETWNSCGNIKLLVFENASKFAHFIVAFNTNTNAWIAQYVYKRLKFLNNKLISQGVSLLFLAVWHGFHSGYYLCFLNEFVVMLAEREVEALIAKNEKVTKFLANPLIIPLKWVVLKLYTVVFMGFSLVPFVLLTYDRYWPAYKSIYFSGYLLFVGWHLYAPLVRRALKPARTPARTNVHQD